MQVTLEDFFKALRGSDLEVALSARIDASRAALLVGFADREVLKDALGTTLAKTAPERLVFDACFERFFAVAAFESLVGAGPDAASTDGVPASGQVNGAGGAGGGGGGGANGDSGQAAGTGLTRMLLDGDRAGLTRAMRDAARAVGITDIWFFTQKNYYVQRIQRQMGLDELEREIAEASAKDDPDAPLLEQARTSLRESVRDFVEQQLSLYGSAPSRQLREDFLMNQRLSNIDQRNFNAMHEIVRKLAKRLAQRHARRKRQNSGQLDFRRVLRANAAHGGMLFDLHWKSRVIERPRVIAICDVSGSVRSFAHFLLLFLYSLNELVPDIRAFAFTNRLVEVSDSFRHAQVGAAVDLVMKNVAGSGSDYGQMFLDLRATLLEQVDRKTTVLILGDGRNNKGNPQAGVLQALQQRARRVIWLNPEPRSFWGSGDSEMLRYAPYCQIARECNSVRHLERALDELLRGGV